MLVRLAVLFTAMAIPLACAGSQDALRLQGSGDQVYRCERGDGGFAWRSVEPAALLRDTTGKPVVQHGSGPHWSAEDGSSVYGTVVTSMPAPRADAIPWLVLRASRHEGAGMMADVAYILRTDTQGGLPPTGGCDARNANAEFRSHYSATYAFIAAPAEGAAPAVPTLTGAQP